MGLNIAFGIMVLSMGCAITLPLFFRYAYYLDVSVPVKVVLFLLCIFIASLMTMMGHHAASLFGKWYPFVQYAGYFVFISTVILFSITLFRDLFWTIGYFSFKSIPSPLDKTILTKVNLITIALAISVSAWALYEGIKVPSVKEVVITSDKIQGEEKIVMLSDLHISRTISPSKIKGIVDKVNELNPSVVVLVGDIIDDRMKDTIGDKVALLKGLEAKKGVYFTTGNHEFYTGYKQSVDMLTQQGFIPLENKGVEIIPSLFIAGVSDYSSSKRFNIMPADLAKAFAGANDDKSKQYRVLLSHTPLKDFGNDVHFDLELSGHTHGGQIFPFHIFSYIYNNGLLAGLYDIEKGRQVYVSRGTGQWGPQMRFLAPTEITLITLSGV